jgi:hypothetical protein
VRITAHCRARIAQKTANDLENVFDYAGIGIAMLTLIDSTARATITHSDSEPIASEAATASISLDEATGAERPLKPKAPGDRIMAEILHGGQRITPATSAILQGSSAILRRRRAGKRQNGGEKR